MSPEGTSNHDRPNGPLLSVEGLTVTYTADAAGLPAVDDVELAIDRGERVALVGESGSGKTAVCLAIAGFLPPSAVVSVRSLRFGGRRIERDARRRALPRQLPGLAMVFQDAMTSLDPVATIGSQLMAVMRRRATSRREARDLSREWLMRVGLTDTERVLRARPWELSGGMRQRAMIAIALSGEPALLVADEPTSALDASLARDAMELLVELTDRLGTSLLIVSHDVALCQEYSDRTMVMYGGKIVEEIRSSTISTQARHPYTIALLRSVPTLESAELDELPTIALPQTGMRTPDGCNFRSRCEHAHERCATAPGPATVIDGHVVRCWLAEDRTDLVAHAS